ncbi:hypothetical protein HBI56_201690 [Parastagonospora nodorum]|uniref:Uncharacterized protein n=2 Tax=Phaeosphaeria nodorum (strain SN15 / ATCC MYA-4574 / FGSC 10173) TaxID=321614 RepID=A0A7U2EZW2_PHANO|nr:hypothetical protein HBH56_216220 [Parastagonospora nodorum]QRC93919.1 hypothetical protein JI435_155860 [Parastagonospora nodorum SN15]KAH3922654.1 hypothetical protein HBH54_221300 [Parastagonospora nodorum]KAH3942052.1 hypothetical protein HBH53_191210 [Parastagonospora nodorum]KAH3961287.1 hypothetical protein HBH51_184900 [Parastagonospora nodorum]
MSFTIFSSTSFSIATLTISLSPAFSRDDQESSHSPVWLATSNSMHTSILSRVTTLKSNPPSHSPVTVPSSNRRDTLDSLDLRQATEGQRHPSPHPTIIQSDILDLNSNPVRPNSPHPVLRRTASGRLFHPSNRFIHAVEMMEPVMTEEEEKEELARWARREDVRTGKRRMNAKGKRVVARNGRVAGEVRRLEAISSGSLPLGLRVDFSSDGDEFEGEEMEYECSSEAPVESGGPVGGVVSETLGVGSPEQLLERSGDKVDVCMDPASSEGAATDLGDVWIDLA